MQTMQDLITTIRALRKELGVPEKESAPIHLHASNRIVALADANQDMLSRMARVASIDFSTNPLSGANARSTADFDVAVIYERQIDIPPSANAQERTRQAGKDPGLSRKATEQRSVFGQSPSPHRRQASARQHAETKTLYDKTKAALDALNQLSETLN